MLNDFNSIFQNYLPVSPWHELYLKKLPGINPLDRNDWIVVDSAFNKQMQYADYLLKNYRNNVLNINLCAIEASKELLENILDAIKNVDGYKVSSKSITRPDGRIVNLDWEQTLLTARSIVQQDLCIMMQSNEEHFLAAAAMCFPASWKLSEKIMQPMSVIHKPVDEFTDNIGKRVERMFSMMRPDQDMWRANWLIYNDPNLYQPRRASESRPKDSSKEQWVRVERQSFCKLPNTKAIIFGIHTYLVPFSCLTDNQKVTLGNIIN